MIIYSVLLNSFREYKLIVREKYNIGNTTSTIIIALYNISMLIIGSVVGYLSYFNIWLQIYSVLILLSWILILPNYKYTIRIMSLVNRILKNLFLLPVIIIAIISHPFIILPLIILCQSVNKRFYSKISRYKSFPHLSFVINLALLLITKSVVSFLILLIIPILINYYVKKFTLKKIILDSLTCFITIYLSIIIIDRYKLNNFSFVTYAIFITLLTKNSLLCQYEQFLNSKKSLMNVSENLNAKLCHFLDIDTSLIKTFIIINSPSVFLIVQYNNDINLFFRLFSVIIVCVFEYVLYLNLLSLSIYRFLMKKMIISTSDELISIRYTPLFILALVPLVQFYYIYSTIELNIMLVFALLMTTFIITSLISTNKLKQSIYRELKLQI